MFNINIIIRSKIYYKQFCNIAILYLIKKSKKMEHLQIEYDFFNRNQQDLLQKYLNKYIVIIGEDVKGNFDDELEAYIYGCQNFGVGTFMLKHCIPFQNQILQTFNNRVIF